MSHNDRVASCFSVGIHCANKSFEYDETGNITGVNASAFRVDPDGISCNWLEHSGNSFEEQFSKMCGYFRNSLTVRPKNKVGLMSVEKIEDTGNRYSIDVSVFRDPIDTPYNPSHCLIKGADPENSELMQELALIVVIHNYA